MDVAFEVVRRYRNRVEQSRVAETLAANRRSDEPEGVTA